jgi:hypothetical protein
MLTRIVRTAEYDVYSENTSDGSCTKHVMFEKAGYNLKLYRFRETDALIIRMLSKTNYLIFKLNEN